MTASELLTEVTRLLTTVNHLRRAADAAETAEEHATAYLSDDGPPRIRMAEYNIQAATAHATIAQAQALTRIADCLETLVDVLAKREADANEVWTVGGLNQKVPPF